MCGLEAVLKMLNLDPEVSGGCVERGERALSLLVAAGGRFLEISRENEFCHLHGRTSDFICVELNLWVSKNPMSLSPITEELSLRFQQS